MTCLGFLQYHNAQQSRVCKVGSQSATLLVGMVPSNALLQGIAEISLANQTNVSASYDFISIDRRRIHDPVGIDYDPVDDRVYWTDFSLRTVSISIFSHIVPVISYPKTGNSVSLCCFVYYPLIP